MADDVESSWSSVLTYAHQEGLQLGKEIVFTYGPLGFLTIPCFSGSFVALRLIFDVVLSLAVSIPLCLLAWRLSIAWRFLLLCTFLVVTSNIQSEAQDLLIYVGLFCWGFLCLQESGLRLWVHVACFILFASLTSLTKLTCLVAAGVSVGAIATDLALRKAATRSADFQSAVSPIGNRQSPASEPHVPSARQTVSLRYSRLKIYATRPAATIGLFILLLIPGWLFNGQSLLLLPTFFSRGFLMAGKYDQTMGLEPSLAALIFGLLAAGAALTAVIVRCRNAFEPSHPLRRWRQCVLLIWLTSLIFLTWKHGFVRADSIHVFFLAGFLPVITLLIQAPFHDYERVGRATPCARQSWLDEPRGRRDGAAMTSFGAFLAIACCTFSLVTVGIVIQPDHLRLALPLRRAVQNTVTLLGPGAYRQRMDQRLELERTRMALPDLHRIIGSSTVDVFGNLPSYAVLNSMNYRPRPVFQSYAAYSAPLTKLNQQFYLSESRPDYVICFLAPIDSRFPTLEDGLTLCNLLINYDLAASEDAFVLLKSRQQPATETDPKLPRASYMRPAIAVSSPSHPLEERAGERRPLHTRLDGERALSDPQHLKLLTEGTIRVGERIDLTSFGNQNTWLEIAINPSLAGRLRQFLYQPPAIRLAVWDDAGRPIATQFRAPAPMLAAGFLASPLILNNATITNFYASGPMIRPAAYAVELDAAATTFWGNLIRFRLYKIENTFGVRLSDFVRITHNPPVVPRGGEQVQVDVPIPGY
jgi:hypothetical protein